MVVINPDCLHLVSQSKDVWSINTDTRKCSSEQAYRDVYKIATDLRRGHVSRVYKKIDSTLRGHPGAEIEALMDAWETPMALVVPSFPGNHRIVQNGYVIINAHPDAGGASDKSEAICHVPSVLKREMKRSIGQIGLDKVREGVPTLLNTIKEAQGEEQVLVIDAVTNADLETVARVIAELPPEVAVVGSAGLAAYLPLAWNLRHQEAVQDVTQGTTMVLVGSRNPVTTFQVKELAEAYRVNPLLMDIERLVTGFVAEESQRLVQAIRTAIRHNQRKGANLVILAVDPYYHSEDSSLNVSELIASTMGSIVKEVLEEVLVNNMLMTGGDTAYHICRALGAIGIDLETELFQGIPLGFLVGGSANGIPVVTKAGGFGEADSLIKVVQFLTVKTNKGDEKNV